jgi:hypothetical protein
MWRHTLRYDRFAACVAFPRQHAQIVQLYQTKFGLRNQCAIGPAGLAAGRERLLTAIAYPA